MNGAYRYKGEEGSLNFHKGVVYILHLETRGFDGSIIVRVGDFLNCPYKSWEYFRKYWEPVE